MLPKEIVRKIKGIEIKTRHVVNSTFTGEYHSVFKGQGINFAEVREYVPGDDVRLIDWNVSAKMNTPFIKVFEEERELTVFLMVDISGSGAFGSNNKIKQEIVSEIAAVLGFSAINNQDNVGLLLFSDIVEKYVPPKKGKAHIMRLIRDIFYFKGKHKKTSIKEAANYLNRTLHKKSIVFVLSDFLDSNFEKPLSVLSKKHDVIPIVIQDKKELEWFNHGVLLIEDLETHQTLLINSSSNETKSKFKNIKLSEKLSLNRLFKSLNIRPIYIRTDENITKPLVQFFKERSHLK